MPIQSIQVAFANYRFWVSSGLALGFALMRFTSIDAYLFIAFVFLLLGILGYFVVELYDLFVVSYVFLNFVHKFPF